MSDIENTVERLIYARLTILYDFDKDEDGNPREERAGEIALAARPQAGDVIDVLREGELEPDVVTVRYVHHCAVAVPLPETAFPSMQRTKPSLEIVADYTPFALRIPRF
ncbi:hypothetical protein EKN06_12395 [Croceicoccus ponticola]|uniref:Uncharacterized protein n=1 Tax=Croceicoccus ponticola TaxID=2217664 RepID=A0A437GVS8_9SPHN|nr:hypothetical protein [Croceicoccus ponticola]RVQ65728.1 hypothetical protein EKN06_12395 [Croceicoccus ponticola]